MSDKYWEYPDGTRRYKSNPSVTYKPVGRYKTRKPDHPDAVRFGGDWFLPLDVLELEQRTMPRTRPDEQGYDHKLMCKCQICKDNPSVLARKQADLGIRLGSRTHAQRAPRR